MAKNPGGARWIAAAQAPARPRRGVGVTGLVLERRHASEPKTQLATHAEQKLAVAAASVPEGEVVARDHVACRQASDQDLLDEGFGGPARERRIEPQHDQEIDPHGLETTRLETKRRQAEGFRIGLEHPSGMGLEGQHPPLDAGVAGDASGLGDHRLVAAMHPVEIADGNRRVPCVPGQIVEMTKDPHGAKKVSAPRARVKGKPGSGAAIGRVGTWAMCCATAPGRWPCLR